MKKNIFDSYADAVAEQFHLTLDEMFAKKRRRDITDARQILYLLCMERPIRLSDIKRFMSDNGLDLSHSTIIFGYNQAIKKVNEDQDYAHLVEKLKKIDV